jgi:hypothetical protein
MAHTQFYAITAGEDAGWVYRRLMTVSRKILGLTGVALGAAAVLLSPAIGAPGNARPVKRLISLENRGGIGSFTPASADPRLAAAFARSGMSSSGFRFTPAGLTGRSSRAVMVAVRARSTSSRAEAEGIAAAAPLSSITPMAYNLGVAVGWKQFAVSGDVVKTDLGLLQGGREGVDVGVSYSAKRWSTRLQLAADRPTPSTPRLVGPGESVSLDVGGSYSIARNIDLTAGLRYKSERDRLQPLTDNRRDSQAVYIGTAFKF